MSLETALLQAACDHANSLEAQLQSYAENWTTQVRELTEQLQIALREKDEAVEKLNQIRRQFATEEHNAAKTCVPESAEETQTHGPRQTGEPRNGDKTETPWPTPGRTNQAHRPRRGYADGVG